MLHVRRDVRFVSRTIATRLLALLNGVAACSRSALPALALVACGGTTGAAPKTDASVSNAQKAGGEVDGGGPLLTADSGEETGGDELVEAGGLAEGSIEAATTPSAPQTFVRFADWAPDAPPAGFDFCLAAAGSTQWIGPLLQQTLPAGSLGQGGANGLEFPSVTMYLPIAPGTYDLQIVATGSTDCTTGVIATTMGLPFLAADTHTTFAVIGDVRPTDNDASLKVGAFPDDSTTTGAGAIIRAINAIPSLAYIDVGTGSVAANDYSPLLVDVPFGSASSMLPDGGTADPNGYTVFPSTPDIQFSAQASGTGTDSATATHVAIAAGTVTTFALINGENGGIPPQFLVCTDNGTPVGPLAPCKVFPQ